MNSDCVVKVFQGIFLAANRYTMLMFSFTKSLSLDNLNKSTLYRDMLLMSHYWFKVLNSINGNISFVFPIISLFPIAITLSLF